MWNLYLVEAVCSTCPAQTIFGFVGQVGSQHRCLSPAGDYTRQSYLLSMAIKVSIQLINAEKVHVCVSLNGLRLLP